MSVRPLAISASFSSFNALASPWMLFSSSVGPSPGANALVNASMTAAGFLRSSLQKSKTKRNVNPSGSPSSARVRNGAVGGAIGMGRTRTGISTSGSIASRT